MRKYGNMTEWQYLCEHDWLDTIAWCLRHSRSFYISVELRYNENRERDEIVMARKKDVKEKSVGLGDWNGIANVTVESEHKDRAIELLSGTDDKWQDDIGDLIALDYKFVLRWDDRSDCPYLSVSCYGESDTNFKYSLITRAPNWRACFALFWVKHFEVAEGDWTQDAISDNWG